MFFKSREFRLGIFIALCLLLLAFFVRRFSADVRQREELQKAVASRLGSGFPRDGLAQNPVGDKVPGNPENGITDLQLIGKFIGVYRSRHSGAYPTTMLDLNGDYVTHCKEYGLRTVDDAIHLFMNPDNRYADNNTARQDPGNTITYMVQGKRLDGSPVGGSKKLGERDVLAFTETYFHQNVVNQNLPQHDTMNPVGFYLVLFDDGSVEKVTWDKIRLVRQGNSTNASAIFKYGFPTQVGVPDDAPTMEQHYRDIPRPNK